MHDGASKGRNANELGGFMVKGDEVEDDGSEFAIVSVKIIE